MNIKLFGYFLGICGVLAACGDSTGTGGTGGSGGSTTTAGGGNGTGGTPVTGGAPATGGGGVGGGEALTCQTGCEALFACGLEGTPQYCPGFTPADEDTFVPGCVETCMGMMALLSVINPDDCMGTVDTLKTLSPDEFAPVCENGFGQGGAGGGA